MPWDERNALIRRTFASGALMDPEAELAWRKAFDRDPELMGRILKDILKAEQAAPGRPGPRPALDAARAEPLVDSWLGRDYADRPYATLPFGEAFALLTNGRSLRNVSRMVDIPRMTVHRLMRGELTPTAEMMVKIAQTFNKQPSYFVEWRIGAVASAMVEHLTNRPERSVRAYETLFWTAPTP
jgi:hypothetical protein